MIRKTFSNIDWMLLTPASLLVVMSSITLISFHTAGVRLVTQGLVTRHITFSLLGIGLALVIAQFDYRLLHGLSRKLFWIALISLILVLTIGESSKGATRWISLFGVGVQPVEFVKIVSIILMAKYLATYHRKMASFWSILFSGVPSFIFVGLIIIQPDFGSAMILMMIWIGMTVLGGIRLIHMLYLLLMGGVSSLLAWTMVLRPYQKQRVLTFFNPMADPLGSGYNTLQSIRSVSAGGWMGEGVGTGVQATYVPEVHTDFIFSGFAQEWGFLGVSIYFIILGLLFSRLFFLANEMQDVFSRMIIVGTIIVLSVQIIINIGMNIGILPITGSPLPFMSYGGSSMISVFLLIGLILSIKKHRQSEGTVFMREQYDIFG